MSSAVMPLALSVGATRPDRVVSPELALVDPVLAAEERIRLPDRVASPRARTWGEPRAGERQEIPERTPAAQEDHEVVARTGDPSRLRRRIAAIAVVIVVAAVLLDIRVDVGRMPVAAENAPKPARSNSRPDAPATVLRARPPRIPAARRFAWAPVPGADSYRVEIFLGHVRVFAASSKTAQLTVPTNWTHGGRRRTLTSGDYRWYVWPVTSGRRSQNAVVQATLTVP